MIPNPDPLPLPAPVWLLQLLMILTFALHLIAMNFVVGGLIYSLVSEWRGRRGDERHRTLRRDIIAALPVVMAPTITLGVAPLLFVQVLYGQALFTTSVLIAYFWLAVIPLLIVAYYGLYLRAWKKETWPRLVSPVAALVSLVLLLTILFIFVNNMSLVLRPSEWERIYRARQTGFALNLNDPQIIPRLLHILTATLAVSAAGIALLGWRRARSEPEVGEWMMRYGARGFILFTALQVIIGPLFLLSQPGDIVRLFLGGNVGHTLVLVISILFAVAAVALLYRATSRSPDTRQMWLGAACLLLTMLGMAWNRQHLREAYLAGSIEPSQMPVATQTGVVALFIILFIVGLLVLGWMLRALIRGEGLRTTS